jgi:hypothetical protein
MNAHVRTLPPDGITATQSYTWVLREVFIDKLTSLTFFSGFNLRRTRRVVIKAADLPVLGVYIIDESMVPDGDGNAGHLAFVSMSRIGFQVIIANNDEAAAESKLDAAYWQMMNGLWRDAYITNLLTSKAPDNVRLESIMRGVRRHVWGAVGLNNETPVAELQYEASILFRDEFAPSITDDLTSIHEQTGFPADHDGSVDSVDQVEVVYTFTPSTAANLMRGRSNPHGRNAKSNAATSGARYPTWLRGAQGGAQGAPRGNPQE